MRLNKWEATRVILTVLEWRDGREGLGSIAIVTVAFSGVGYE